MNLSITQKVSMETDAAFNPDKKTTKIAEFNITDMYRLDNGELCF